MSMNFEDMVRCNHCMKVFHQNEIIYDEGKDKELCPYCGKGGGLMDIGEIKLAINHEKLAACGFSFDGWSDMYLYVESIINWLESHNKNYTKEQYYKISNLKEILGCIDYGV